MIQLYGKRAKRNLVAVVPDEMFRTALSQDWKGAVRPLQLDRWVRSSCEVTLNPGSMILRPRYPEEARSLRLNRSGMAAYLKKIWAQRDFRVLDFADLLRTQPRAYDGTIGDAWISMSIPSNWDPRFRGPTMNSIPGARILGVLSPEIRNGLDKGVSVPYDRLPRTAQEAIDDWIFNGLPGNLESLPYDGERPDPINVFPNGLASPSKLRLDIIPQRRLVVIRKPGREDISSPEKVKAGSDDIVGFRLAWEIIYILQVEATSAPEGGRALSFSEVQIDRSGPPLNFDQLPADVRAKALKSAEPMRMASVCAGTCLPSQPFVFYWEPPETSPYRRAGRRSRASSKTFPFKQAFLSRQILAYAARSSWYRLRAYRSAT